MASFTSSNKTLTVKAYQGDQKTLLAFNMTKAAAKNLAGFTIQVQPRGKPAYYINNELQFENPGVHAQDQIEPANSSINAPVHKFRWVHVTGSVHQGLTPAIGPYTYTVTPRYFDKGSLQALDPSLSVTLTITVGPFKKNGLELGFTRGFTQSQAFVHHFGLKASISPKGKTLLFDTSQQSGTNAKGDQYTFLDEYQWLGFSARAKIFGILDEVVADKTLQLDMFAYDLNEPDMLKRLLDLAAQGRVRMIVDDAALHHSSAKPKPEDEFETEFTKAAKRQAGIKRGHFKRYSHDKVMIVSKGGKAFKVLTGSTNFSVTGMYVNSNHVLVFNDAKVADTYSQVFNNAWDNGVSGPEFIKSALSGQNFSFSSKQTPPVEISFAPHDATMAGQVLGDLAKRIQAEGKMANGSVFFAVMELTSGSGPVFPAVTALHGEQTIFSYGISDSPGGLMLYTPGKKTGVIVTGKPPATQLPPPFDQVPGVGLGHQIHHKFLVCGFNRPDAVVYCGSSNLAEGGEESNGDNLLAIHDSDVATVFMIEALGLVDHFNFLDRFSQAGGTTDKAPANKQNAALQQKWFLGTTDKWTAPYFDGNDLHFVDRELFG